MRSPWPSRACSSWLPRRCSGRSSTTRGEGGSRARSAGPPPARRLAGAPCRGPRWPKPTRSSPPGTAPASATDALRRAPRVRIVGHCGGEVKGRFAVPLFERITITNAPGPMAGTWRSSRSPCPSCTGSATSTRTARRCAGRSNAVYARIHRDGVGDETLAGRTVGLVGFGRIGRAIAALLRPFGARLLVHDPYVPAAALRSARVAVRSRGLGCSRRSRHLVIAAALTAADAAVSLDRRALARLPDGRDGRERGARGRSWTWTRSPPRCARGRLRCALDVTDPPSPCRRAIRCGGCPGAILTPTWARASARSGRRWRTWCSTTSSASSSRAGAPPESGDARPCWGG